MTHPGHDFPQRLFDVIKAVSTLLLIVLFYILQYLFDMDFVCSCRPGVNRNDVLYVLAPPVILTWAVNTIESVHQRRILSRWQSFYHKNVCRYPFPLLIDYVSLTAVWMTAVLFDGDWYFCLMTNHNVNQTGLPCKKELTYNETRIKADYKTASLVSNSTHQYN